MKQIVQLMPGYRRNEYLLVLVPHEELRSRILSLKKDFSEKFKATVSGGSRPHLTLVKFDQLEMMEDRIVNRLKNVAMGFPPFKVELKDFGSYPSHTIYINVTSKLPIQNLVKDLKQWQRLMKIDNEHKPHFIDEPSIVIARKLVPWQYEQAWREFSHRHFSGKFIADGMMLLKRREGDRKFQIVQRFEFMNLPVTTRQGELLFI